MNSYCFVCGAECSGKMQRRVRKNGEQKPFCQICFHLELTEIKKRMNKC